MKRIKKVWNKSPLSCSHPRHVNGRQCPDCGARIAPTLRYAMPHRVEPLTDDDYAFADAVAAERRAGRAA